MTVWDFSQQLILHKWVFQDIIIFTSARVPINQDIRWCVVWPSTASADMGQISVYFTGAKKMLLSHICSSIVPEQKLTNFAVETPSG